MRLIEIAWLGDGVGHFEPTVGVCSGSRPMKRTTLFESALEDCRALAKRFPKSQSLPSIIEQLEYLLALDGGKVADRSPLQRMTIGVLAAKEVENLDELVGDKLHAVSAEIEKMASER